MKETTFATREKWRFEFIPKDKVERFAKELNVDPLVARLLLVRNIGKGNPKHIAHFVKPSLELIDDISDITTQDDIHNAVSRIQKAIDEKELIMVNGDPDADGISGCTITVAGLRHLGGNVEYDFPVRSTEGHGLQTRIIDQVADKGGRLIITTDCGSKDVEAVDYANSLGVDVIICDHHVLGKKLPKALAIVNPFRVDKKTPFQKLSGASMSLKLILACYEHMGRPIPLSLKNFMLAVATLGTVSDRMTMLEPMNRIIVSEGTKAINYTRMEGLKALKAVTASDYERLLPRDLGRTLVPRLNAPGRIGNPEEGIPDSNLAVEMLLTGTGKANAEKATTLAENINDTTELQKKIKAGVGFEEAAKIDHVNEKRKYITSKIEDEIEDLIQTQVNPDQDRVVIVHGKDWNPGVIGIDTDRLKERFLRPAVILTSYSGSNFVRGSARSIPSISIYKIIDTVSEKFEEQHGTPLFQVEVQTKNGKKKVSAFGGHAQACGFTFHKDHIDEFRRLIHEEMNDVPVKLFNYTHEILDTVKFSDLTPEFLDKLNSIAPYGQNFEFPLFRLQNCLLSKGRPFGNKYQEARTPHLEFTVTDGTDTKAASKKQFIGVGFGLYDKYCALVERSQHDAFDLVFFLETDHRAKSRNKNRKRTGKQTQNHQTIRLNVVDIRVSLKKGEKFDPEKHA